MTTRKNRMQNISKKLRSYYEDINYVNDAETYAKTHREKRLKVLSKYVDIKNLRSTLEVGCGSGVHKHDFKGWIGVDISRTALKKALPSNVIVASADKLPFKNEIFDLVVSFNLIEHLYNPEEFLDECLRVCRKNGYIAIFTPQLKIKTLIYLLTFETLKQFKFMFLKFLGVKYNLRPNFKSPDYTKIGGDADAVYLTDFLDIMLFLKSRKCKILNEINRRYIFWLKRVDNGCIIALKG